MFCRAMVDTAKPILLTKTLSRSRTYSNLLFTTEHQRLFHSFDASGLPNIKRTARNTIFVYVILSEKH